MRTLRDFGCVSCGTVTESLRDTETSQIMCPECCGDAVQLLCAPTVRLEGISGSFPGATEKWARIREDNARIKSQRSYVS